MTTTLLHFLLFVVFLIGLYFYTTYGDAKEAFTGSVESRCPNMLIQKDTRFYLYNSKLAKIPGVNPIEFENLEDYTEFLDWQRSQGIRCPVLYMQQSYDAQGNRVYKIRPSVSEPQGGLPPSIATSSGDIISEDSTIPAYPNQQLLVDATRNDPPYNKKSMPAYDPSSYYVGTTTPLDQMNQQSENMLYSADPMDPNWGGPDFTQSLVEQGFYKENEVQIAVA